MAARRNGGGGSRAGTFLVLIGAVGILATTFLAGVWTGRNWSLLTGATRPTAAEASKTRPTERTRATETLPPLTFYQELTAPLTAPPPPARPSKTRPPDLVRHDAPAEPRREP
ncbi:MAG TPA: hypothetical protein VFL90_20320, partial [Methylomirabilota bacterium]|nr:hypothetical protein [Methylomirabilota bacterium]